MATLRDQIRAGHATFYQGLARSQAEWEAAAEELLQAGQAFLACDLARAALAQFPQSVKLKQVLAQALRRTGALAEARELLESLCPPGAPDAARLLDLCAQARGAVEQVAGAQAAPGALAALERAVRELGEAVASLQSAQAPDEETLGILARVYKDMWRRSGDPQDLLRARDTYLRGFQLTRGIYTGINAATLSWLAGEREQARDLARQVLAACDAPGPCLPADDDPYWPLATRGEARLLLGDEAGALAAYRAAFDQAGRKYAFIISSLQQIKLLAERDFPVPAALFDILKPPAVVVCAGLPLDRPGAPARFPAERVATVREEIERHLDELDARIGYSSAACGTDLLFVEALLARDAEVHLVLPFGVEDFARERVAYGGPAWAQRFERAIHLADSVRYVTREPFLAGDVLPAFAAQLFYGYADLHARTLETEPYLLAVWDGRPDDEPGGTADLLARWPQAERLHVIRIGDEAPALLAPTAPPLVGGRGESPYRRVVKALLFANVVGHEELQEAQRPFFMCEFVARVAEELERLEPRPAAVSRWGDALFAALDAAEPLVDCAFTLLDVAARTAWAPEGGTPVSVRIALHAGPVIAGTDPFSGKPAFYGAQITRGARLEPLLAPGRVYASEQFVALLRGEQVAAEHAARLAGRKYRPAYACDYAGTLDTGSAGAPQAVYHIRQVAR